MSTPQEEHSLLGPSRAHRYLHCIGSLAMEGDNRTTSAYAEEGTLAHKLAALALTNARPASAYIGRILDPKDKQPITQEMADFVQIYLDRLKEYAGGEANPHHIDVELLVDVSPFLGVEKQFGTLDAGIYITQDAELQIHDLKYGMGVRVDAEHNEQMMLYALGRYHVVSLMSQVKTVLLVIHQPRLNHVSEWRCSIEDLLKFPDFAIPRARKAFELYKTEIGNITAGQHLTAGVKQCRFCNARPTCPELAKLAHKEVIEHFGDLDAPGVPKLPENNTELGRLGKLVPLLRTLCNATEAKINAELLSGRPVPGFKLVKGRAGNRYWTDKEAAAALLAQYELKENHMELPQLKSVSAIEKITGKKHEVWKDLAAWVDRADGKATVAEEADPRPAMEVVPVETLFSDLEADKNE